MQGLKRLLIPIVCLAGCVLFAVLGVHQLKNRKVFSPATATITDIQSRYSTSKEEREYDVYVEYTVDGQTYNTDLGEYSSTMKVGKSIDILYNPDNPTEIMAASLFSTVLMFIMSFVCLIGVFLAIRKILMGRSF